MNIRDMIRGLLIPPGYQDDQSIQSSLQLQWQVLKRIWQDERESLGLERLVRLGLAASVFLFPSIYLRQVYGRRSLLLRKIGSDVLVLLKLLLPFLLLHFQNSSAFWAVVVSFLLVETIVYVAGNLMLADIYGQQFSDGRTFLLLLLNYWEITVSFAYLYYYSGVVGSPTAEAIGDATGVAAKSTCIEAIYFSTVVSTTLGFGDIAPKSDLGRMILTIHVWMVAIVIMTAISSVVGEVRKRS